MKNRSKMILGLASLLGVTAGATAVSGFAWFVTTKTAAVNVTNIGVYNNNPSLTMHINNPEGITQIANTGNDYSFSAVKDSTTASETATGDGTKTAFVLTGAPVRVPTAYVDGKLTATTYDSGTNTVTFTGGAPASGAAIKFVYWDNAALTDISSIDGVNFYDPTWQVANEGKKATIIPTATAGEHYISFEMEFVAPTEGSLEVFLDRPTITAKDPGKAADVAAASVARVGFATAGTTNKLTISNNVAAGYEKGISKSLVEDYGDGHVNANTTPDGDYTITNVLANCQNLVVPSTENYSILSAAPTKDASHNHIATINGADVTVLVTIWLEGTSAVNADGNYSDPIGGEINVSLPIVAFGA